MMAMLRTRLMAGVERYTRDHFAPVVEEHPSVSGAFSGDEAAAAAAIRSDLAHSRRRFKMSARP
ncbi:hypothetical protein [Arthrobacter sp. D3-16]